MKESLYRVEASCPFGSLTLAVRSNEIDIASDALQAATLGRCHPGMVRVKTCRLGLFCIDGFHHRSLIS